MSEERKKPGLGFWIVVVVASILLYVLSSGPARTLLVQKRTVIPIGPHGATLWLGPTVVVTDGKWKTLYSPLEWAATEKFGTPLRWYWDFFPVSEMR